MNNLFGRKPTQKMWCVDLCSELAEWKICDVCEDEKKMCHQMGWDYRLEFGRQCEWPIFACTLTIDLVPAVPRFGSGGAHFLAHPQWVRSSFAQCHCTPSVRQHIDCSSKIFPRHFESHLRALESIASKRAPAITQNKLNFIASWKMNERIPVCTRDSIRISLIRWAAMSGVLCLGSGVRCLCSLLSLSFYSELPLLLPLSTL